MQALEQHPFYVPARKQRTMLLQSPVSGIRMKASTENWTRAQHDRPVTAQLQEIYDTEIRINEMRARFNLVLGTTFGIFAGFCIAVATFHMAGFF